MNFLSIPFYPLQTSHSLHSPPHSQYSHSHSQSHSPRLNSSKNLLSSSWIINVDEEIEVDDDGGVDDDERLNALGTGQDDDPSWLTAGKPAWAKIVC